MRKGLLPLLLLVGAVLSGPGVASTPARAQAQKPVEIVLFYGRGCLYCAAMRDYLGTLKARYPQLSVRDYEVYFNGDNARLFERVADAYKFTIEGVPTTFLGDRVYSGYGEDLKPEIEAQIKTCMAQGCGFAACPRRRRDRAHAAR